VKTQVVEPSSKLVVIIPLLTTLLVTPGLNSEPQILGKFTFFALATFALSIFLMLKGELRIGRYWAVVGLAIIVAFSASVLVNQENLSEQIYGVYGRNNGLLLLIASIVFFLVSLQNKSEAFENLVLKKLIQAGWIVIAYYYFQFIGWDLIPWNQIYDSPVSTLGNPNFLSAFVALFIFANFANLGNLKGNSPTPQIIFCVSVIVGLLTLYLTNSQQGFLLIPIGLWIWAGKYFYERRLRAISVFWTIITCTMFAIISLGAGSLGPGKKIFLEYSLAIRKKYWIAGLEMFRENWVFGNGMNSYLYQFDAYKSSDFVLKHGGTLTSSSAHNVYIDLLQGAGIFAGVLYILLNLMIAIIGVKKVLSRKVSQNYWVILIIWILIQVQSLISIQNIVINAWQWILSAIIVSKSGCLPFMARMAEPRRYRGVHVKNSTRKIFFIVALLPFIFVTPLAMIQDVRFASAIKTSNGNALINLSKSFPYDTYRFNYSAKALEEARYWYWALELARHSVKENSRNKEGWIIIFESGISNSEEKTRAREELSKLDPFWKPS
jgi:O-antigen ligase